jgi:hypothetical protein
VETPATLSPISPPKNFNQPAIESPASVKTNNIEQSKQDVNVKTDLSEESFVKKINELESDDKK